MAELALAREFLAAYAALQKPVRRAVDAAIGKFAEHTHAGLHLEKIVGSRDPNIRTIKVSDFYRGVVLAAGDAKYVFLTVKPHDDAITYAKKVRFTVNQVLGVLEVRDQQRIEELAQALPSAEKYFDWVSDKDLLRLGIEA